MIKLDALLLIDCWDKQNLHNPKSDVNYFYTGIIDFTKNLTFKKVFFCSGYVNGLKSTEFKTDKIFEDYYTKHWYVFDIKELLRYLDKDSNVLVGGAAWGACLHNKAEMNFNLLRKYYNVYSHPKLVDSELYTEKVITEHDFISDILPWKKTEDLFYLEKFNGSVA
jgi:hypothetical protein